MVNSLFLKVLSLPVRSGVCPRAVSADTSDTGVRCQFRNRPPRIVMRKPVCRATNASDERDGLAILIASGLQAPDGRLRINKAEAGRLRPCTGSPVVQGAGHDRAVAEGRAEFGSCEDAHVSAEQ